MVILYVARGLAIADGEVMNWAENLAKEFNRRTTSFLRAVSCETMVNAIRLLIARGVLDHKEVVFTNGEETIRSNRYGRLDSWPKGFCSQTCDMMEELLMTAYVKKKNENRKENNETKS